MAKPVAAIFQNLEQQQQRAKDLMEAGDFLEAGKVLQSTIQTRRQKQNYTILEDLGRRLIDCAFHLKTLGTLKEVLTHFRNVCQHQSPESIKRVFDYFMERLGGVGEQIGTDALSEIQDIEREKAPEEVILCSFDEEVESDTAQAQGKFILEGYKVILEILRNNSQMLESYNKAASEAFEFCAKHSRRQEFKRLCDFLRNHLQQMIENEKKTPEQLRTVPHPMRLTDAQTTQYVLDLRERELEIAMQMHLTKDAYSVIQDIKFLLHRIGRKMDKQKLKDYLGLVARVFLDAGYFLYHAEACSLILGLSLSLHASDADKRKAAEALAMAALAVPVAGETESVHKVGFVSNKTQEIQAAKQAYDRNSGLLNSAPTKASLLRDVRHHLLLCGPEVTQLVELLEEKNVKPSHIAKQAEDALKYVEQEAPALVKAIREQLCLRVLRLLAASYSSMKLEALRRLTRFLPFTEALRVMQLANMQKQLVIEVNFKRAAVFFKAPELSGHQLTASTLRLVELVGKLSRTEALITGREHAGISEDVRRRAVKKASENVEEDKEQIRESQRVKHAAGQQHQQKVKSLNEAMLEDQKQTREREQREKEEAKKLEQNLALLKRLLMQRDDIKRQQRQEYLKELKEKGVKVNEAAETETLVDELEKLEEKEKHHLKAMAQRVFKQCSLATVARREQEHQKLQAQWERQEEPRQKRILDYFQEKHAVELKMKKKFDIFIVHYQRFFGKQQDQRQADLKQRMDAYQEKRIAQVKESIMNKARQLHEAAERKKTIREAERKRELRNEELKRKAMEESASGKRAAFGSGKVEGVSENSDFKRGGGVTDTSSSDLAGFGFGKPRFNFTGGKGGDQDWKKGKPAEGGAAKLNLPAPRDDKAGSKLVLPPPREEKAKLVLPAPRDEKMALPPPRVEKPAVGGGSASKDKDSFGFGSFRPGTFKNTRKDGGGEAPSRGMGRGGRGGAKAAPVRRKFSTSSDEEEGAGGGDGFNYGKKHGK